MKKLKAFLEIEALPKWILDFLEIEEIENVFRNWSCTNLDFRLFEIKELKAFVEMKLYQGGV